MQTETQKKRNELYRKLRKLRYYQHALGILNFDFETIAPKNAKPDQGATMSFFANEAFKLQNSRRMKELIVYLHEHREELDPLDRRLSDLLYDSYEKQKNVTPADDLRWSNIYNKAYMDWENAKRAADFSLFSDSLAAVIEAGREQVALRENKLPDLYDNFLNDYERGVLSDELDRFFDELKDGLRSLIARIRASKHKIRTDFLSRKVPIPKQQAFSDYLLRLNGYDFDRGAITTTEHPFTSDIAENDARVTTHYHEDMVLSNMYSVIHEGGHAIFMQNEPAEDYAHFINDEISNGMHESVSRFYENVIGRSEEYIHLIYPKFHELFAEELGDVSERELYEAVNLVEPSLIRTEADEVTYGLHIVIRYEMEKKICSGELPVEAIPDAWSALYDEYLGVRPRNDAEGVLQDVHWTGGFGYFPSYALGNAYNAMYLQKIEREMDFRGAIREGRFSEIKEWMRKNVFAEANRLSPKEWLLALCGRPLTAKDFLAYLERKYTDIYRL